MNGKIRLFPAEAVGALAARLSKVASISSLDRPSEPEASTLAHSLSDLEASFRTLLDELMPRLLDESLNAETINETLLDIGEELRHILYHVRDPKFFDYLFEDDKRDPSSGFPGNGT